MICDSDPHTFGYHLKVGPAFPFSPLVLSPSPLFVTLRIASIERVVVARQKFAQSKISTAAA